MIRTQVCWDAAVRIAAGLSIVAVGDRLAELLWGVPFVGWLLALVVLVPTLLYGVYVAVRGLWLVVEEAAREAREGDPDPLVEGKR